MPLRLADGAHRRSEQSARIRILAVIPAGGEIEVVKYDGEPHAFIARSPTAPAPIAALERMTRYIHARLG